MAFCKNEVKEEEQFRSMISLASDDLEIPSDLIEGLLVEELSCSICLGVLDDTVVTECLHRFCRDCIGRHLRQLEKRSHECPLCREKINSLRTLRKDTAMDEFITLFVATKATIEVTLKRDIAKACSTHSQKTREMQEMQRTKSKDVLERIELDKKLLENYVPPTKKRKQCVNNSNRTNTKPVTWRDKYPTIAKELKIESHAVDTHSVEGLPFDTFLTSGNWVDVMIIRHPNEEILGDMVAPHVRLKGNTTIDTIKGMILAESMSRNLSYVRESANSIPITSLFPVNGVSSSSPSIVESQHHMFSNNTVRENVSNNVKISVTGEGAVSESSNKVRTCVKEAQIRSLYGIDRRNVEIVINIPYVDQVDNTFKSLTQHIVNPNMTIAEVIEYFDAVKSSIRAQLVLLYGLTHSILRS